MPSPPSAAPTQEFDIPNPFGRYRLLRKLGEGGMGSVYLAEDSRLNREVALKVPRDTESLNTELVARFYREARVLAGFNHPNICRVYDVGEHDGRLYLTMEYQEGETLETLLRNGPHMAPVRAARLARTVARALQEAHDRGVVHRDLKPSNLLLTDGAGVVILDFGLARGVESSETRLTLSGVPLGTPAYMSPEQVMAEADRIGPACDIYSLGVILYEMLCGRRPFHGPLSMLFVKIVHERPEPPSAFRPDLDPELVAVCTRALEKSPSDRQASMAEFADALDAWLARQEDPEKRSAVGGQRSLRRTYREMGWIEAGLALAAVLGAVLYVTSDKGRKGPAATAAEEARLAAIRPAGEERSDNGIGLKLCWCPPGSFVMGSPPDEPERNADENQVEVFLASGFWMGKYEITQAQWQAVMGTTQQHQRKLAEDERPSGVGPDLPIDCVSHDEATEFCRRLTASERDARRLPADWTYRLPTEAQWEYACRARSSLRYVFAEDQSNLEEFAWFERNSGGKPQPVGLRTPNKFGLHDMIGNLWELCRDCYYPELRGGVDPSGPLDGEYPAIRGGSWESELIFCRPADRSGVKRSERFFYLGFRVALCRENPRVEP